MKITTTILAFLLLLSSCQVYDRIFKGDVVARVGKEVLYVSDIKDLGIKGFSPEDSLQIVQRYVYSWAKSRLLVDMAESHLSKADRDVSAQLEEYRQQLLVYRYEQKYVQNRLDTLITEDEYLQYYQSNPESFYAQTPLIRGLYIKISNNSPNIKMIKSLYRTQNEDERDRLAELSYVSAEKSSFFYDTWMSINVLSQRLDISQGEIQSRFDSHNFMEKSYMGYTYLIYAREYISKGDLLPYEYCRSSIRDIILSKRKQELITSLERNLLNDAISSNKLILYTE